MPNRLFEVTINQGGKNLRHRPPAKDEHIIGRDSACAIAIEDADVSRQYVRLAFYLDELFVEDPRSANGTFVGCRPAVLARATFTAWSPSILQR